MTGSSKHNTGVGQPWRSPGISYDHDFFDKYNYEKKRENYHSSNEKKCREKLGNNEKK